MNEIPRSTPSPQSDTSFALANAYVIFEEWCNKKWAGGTARFGLFFLLFFYRKVKGVHRSTKCLKYKKMAAPMDATCKDIPCPAEGDRQVTCLPWVPRARKSYIATCNNIETQTLSLWESWDCTAGCRDDGFFSCCWSMLKARLFFSLVKKKKVECGRTKNQNVLRGVKKRGGSTKTTEPLFFLFFLYLFLRFVLPPPGIVLDPWKKKKGTQKKQGKSPACPLCLKEKDQESWGAQMRRLRRMKNS